MAEKKAIGLIYGHKFPYIDHIAPLCDWLKIPLIVSDEDCYDLIQKYYPSVVTHHIDSLELPFRVTQEADIVFCAVPTPLFERVFCVTETMMKKKLLSVWTPHGQSDKGLKHVYYEALEGEKMILVYGQKMAKRLIDKGVCNTKKSVIEIGNFRYNYAQRFKPFYDKIVQKEILSHLDPEKKTILYAPSWEDSEGSCSLFNMGKAIIETLKGRYNLIIKPHPNTLAYNMVEAELYLETLQESDNVLIIDRFPPIYPLLEVTDIYIGDMSSIGYDFLTFDRPMIFLNHQGWTDIPLFKGGIALTKETLDLLPQVILDPQKELSPIRKALYADTFASIEPNGVRDQIFREAKTIIDTTFLP